MLKVTAYELDDIKNELKRTAIEKFGLVDAEFEGSNVSNLINLLAYSTVINNTNLTFGLNEMFIGQAKDRRNVIKHARQMGYVHKRKTSYQYKIKIKSKVNGLVTLSKYDTFTSNGNNYVYMGETVHEYFGNYLYLNLLTNEFQNSINNIDRPNATKWYDYENNLQEGSYIISEQGLVCKIIRKEDSLASRLLVEQVNDEVIPTLSNVGQELYVVDTEGKIDENGNFEGPYDASGYRNMLKVGNIDTFIYEETLRVSGYTEGVVKIQVSVRKGLEFPLFTKIQNPPGRLIETIDGSYNIRQFDQITKDISPGDASYDASGKYILGSGQFKREIDGENKTVGTQFPIKNINTAVMIQPDGTRIDLNTCGLTNKDGTLRFDNQKICTNEVHPAATVKNYGLHSALVITENDILPDEDLEIIVYYADKANVRLGDGNVVFVDGRWMFLDGQYTAPASGDYVPADLVKDGLSAVKDGSYIYVDGNYIFIDCNKNWLKDAYHVTSGTYVFVDGNYRYVGGLTQYTEENGSTFVTIDGNKYELDGVINYKLDIVEVTNGIYTIVNTNGTISYIRVEDLYDGALAPQGYIDGNYLLVDGQFTLVGANDPIPSYADGNIFRVDGDRILIDGDADRFQGIDAQYVVINGEYKLIDTNDLSADGYGLTIDGNTIFIDGNYSFIDGNIPLYNPQVTMTQEQLDVHSNTGNIIYMDGNIIFSDGDEIFFLEQNTNTNLYEGDGINSSVTKIQRIKRKDLLINGNNIIIPPQTTFINCWKSEICGARISTPFENVKSVQTINVKTPDGQEFCHEEYLIEENTIILTVAGEPVACYPDGSKLCIDLEYYEKVARSNMIIKYCYSGRPSNSVIELNYSYDKDADGCLDRKFFISDLRGEKLENERNWDPITNPDGFNGFSACDFDEETSILTFKVSNRTGLLENIQAKVDGLIANNTITDEYRQTEINLLNIPTNYYERQSCANRYLDKPLNEALSTPYRCTRFSVCSYSDDEHDIRTFTEFDENTAFAKVCQVVEKNKIEVVVKEGTIKRWNEETDASKEARAVARENNIAEPDILFKYPELLVYPNEDMIKNNYFTILNEDIEHDGIELFVSRLTEKNRIEESEWTNRNELLAEHADDRDESFVITTDLEYEEYINIQTKYAGAGVDFSIDMAFRLNLLTSSGEKGYTNDLIVPNNPNFEASLYNEEAKISSILYIEGFEIESTDSIRKNAPLFSNTANRAVTKKDYLTICESQDFISQAQIWGGETNVPTNKPGWINFSIIPYSRPISFTIDNNNNYILNRLVDPELSFASYFQVTGRDNYNALLTDNKSSLFNILNKYQIISLQFNYDKPIYIDYHIDVNIVRYKVGQNAAETHQYIFNNIQDYFIDDIEKFDSIFFKSSLVRYIDEKLGDNFGIVSNIKTSIDLYDNLNTPDLGVFRNKTMVDLSPNVITGLIGLNDDWEFTLPLSLPIEELFEETLVNKFVVLKRGRLIFDNLTKVDTHNFLESGDYLFMDDNMYNHKSVDLGGEVEDFITSYEGKKIYDYPSEKSGVIEIPVLYRKGDYDRNPITYKVGTYIIYKKEKLAQFILNTNYNNNINNSEVIVKTLPIGNGSITKTFFIYNDLNNNIDKRELIKEVVKDATGNIVDYAFYFTDVVPVDSTINNYIRVNMPKINYVEADKIFITETGKTIKAIKFYSVTVENGNEVNKILIEGSLDRRSFLTTRQLDLQPKDSNMSITRNSFQRLRQVSFL